jgi:hypothetical protein
MARENFSALPPTRGTFLRFAIMGIGWLGVALVTYGIVTAITGEKWLPLERIAEPLSSALTVLGTSVVAVSVYFWGHNETPPEPMSRYITAPLVIGGSGVALGMLCLNGALPVVVVNGFAIVGLAGALLRIQPNPYLR